MENEDLLKPLVDFGERPLRRRLMDSFLDDIRVAEAQYRGGLKTEAELIQVLDRILQNMRASSSSGCIQRLVDHCELVMLEGLMRDLRTDPPGAAEPSAAHERNGLDPPGPSQGKRKVPEPPRERPGTDFANSSSNSDRIRNRERNEVEENG